jgi:hypothetical protein
MLSRPFHLSLPSCTRLLVFSRPFRLLPLSCTHLVLLSRPFRLHSAACVCCFPSCACLLMLSLRFSSPAPRQSCRAVPHHRRWWPVVCRPTLWSPQTSCCHCWCSSLCARPCIISARALRMCSFHLALSLSLSLTVINPHVLSLSLSLVALQLVLVPVDRPISLYTLWLWVCFMHSSTPLPLLAHIVAFGCACSLNDGRISLLPHSSYVETFILFSVQTTELGFCLSSFKARVAWCGGGVVVWCGVVWYGVLLVCWVVLLWL